VGFAFELQPEFKSREAANNAETYRAADGVRKEIKVMLAPGIARQSSLFCSRGKWVGCEFRMPLSGSSSVNQIGLTSY
jgi:hypothetical protein